MTENQRPEATYEEARAELVEVVQRLEAGGSTLEESLALWERGEELARTCQEWLDGARARLHEAMAEADSEGSEDPGGGTEDDGEAEQAPPF